MTKSFAVPGAHGLSAVTPYLICANAAGAIEFYKKAFGATEMFRLPGPDGKIMNAMISICGCTIMLNDEFPEMNVFGPKANTGSPISIHLSVSNADEAMQQAAAAGAKITMPATDVFWGDRFGAMEDPYGHKWTVGQHLRDMTPDEIAQAMRQQKPAAKAGNG